MLRVIKPMTNVMLSVFSRSGIKCQPACLMFFNSWINNFLPNYENDELVEVCNQIMNTLAKTFESLKSAIEHKVIGRVFINGDLYPAMIKLFENMQAQIVHVRKINNTQIIEQLVCSISQLLLQEHFYSKDVGLPAKIYELVVFLEQLFQINGVFKAANRHLDKLLNVVDANVGMLIAIKFIIILDLQESNESVQPLYARSDTYKHVHDIMIEKVRKSAKAVIADFTDILFWIKDYLEMLVSIEFYVTQRKQINHLKEVILKNASNKNHSNENTMMVMENLNFDHVDIKFFRDYKKLVHDLIATIKCRPVFTSVLIQVSIIVFGMLLARLPEESGLDDEAMSFMLAIVSMPFQSSFDQSSLKNASEFKKLKSLIPESVMHFTKQSHLLPNLKCQSIEIMSRLNFTKISKSAVWLITNLMRIVLKQEERMVQDVLLKNFKVFLLNNFELLPSLMTLYQNEHLNRFSVIEIQELKEVICLQNQNVIIMKCTKYSQYLRVNYTVFCNECDRKENLILYDKANALDRILAYMLDTKSHMIIWSSSNNKKSVKKLEINPDTIFAKDSQSLNLDFSKTFHACMKHTKSFTDWIIDHSAKVFEWLFSQNQQFINEGQYVLNKIIAALNDCEVPFERRKKFYEDLFKTIESLSNKYCEDQNHSNYQLSIVKLISAYAINLPSAEESFIESDCLEDILLRCLKLMIKHSTCDIVMTEILRMFEAHHINFEQFFNWYRKEIMTFLTELCFYRCYDTSHSPRSFGSYLRHVS
jgi:hypothetical protein